MFHLYRFIVTVDSFIVPSPGYKNYPVHIWTITGVLLKSDSRFTEIQILVMTQIQRTQIRLDTVFQRN